MKINCGKLFLIIVLFSSCAGVKPVNIKDVGNVRSLNVLSNPEITFDLKVENPNKFGVTVSRINLDLYNSESKLVEINLLEKTKVGKFSEVTLPVSMKPSIETIKSLLKSEMNNLVRGKVNQKMEISGELVMKKFIFRRKIKIKEAISF